MQLYKKFYAPGSYGFTLRLTLTKFGCTFHIVMQYGLFCKTLPPGPNVFPTFLICKTAGENLALQFFVQVSFLFFKFCSLVDSFICLYIFLLVPRRLYYMGHFSNDL